MCDRAALRVSWLSLLVSGFAAYFAYDSVKVAKDSYKIALQDYRLSNGEELAYVSVATSEASGFGNKYMPILNMNDLKRTAMVLRIDNNGGHPVGAVEYYSKISYVHSPQEYNPSDQGRSYPSRNLTRALPPGESAYIDVKRQVLDQASRFILAEEFNTDTIVVRVQVIVSAKLAGSPLATGSNLSYVTLNVSKKLLQTKEAIKYISEYENSIDGDSAPPVWLRDIEVVE